jgi:hypothetical protein
MNLIDDCHAAYAHGGHWHTICGNAGVLGREQIYNQATMLKRRRPVMQAWADFLDGAAADNVLPLKRA